ncbi:MAG: permease [Anaerolineales bacterium]|nr:permease [Anaerolineales bacterium]
MLKNRLTAPDRWGKWVADRIAILLLLGAALFLMGWMLASVDRLTGLTQSKSTVAALGQLFGTFTTIFLGIFIEAAAFLLLGVLASALIQVFVTPERVQRLVPKNRLGATAVGSLLGLIFPVCECGSVPTARRLMHKGAPVPLGIAFLLAAPVINPVVIASTWVAFNGDPLIVGGRIALTIAIAAIIAMTLALHPAARTLLRRIPDTVPSHDHALPAQGFLARLGSVTDHAAAEFFEMGQYVVFGAMIAALAQTFIPQDILLAIGGNPVASVIVLMALAAIMSICSTVDAFVALGFASTFHSGAILAFLVFGPMIDIKAVLLFTTTFKRSAVLVIVLLATLLSFLAATWINLNVG